MWYINIQTLQNLLNVFVKTTEEKKENSFKTRVSPQRLYWVKEDQKDWSYGLK